MDPTIAVNQRVDVVAIFEKGKDVSVSCMPYKMRYQGRDIVFTKRAFHHPTAKGKRMIHVFDMSDSTNDYRLEFDAESLTWMLIAVIEGVI